MAKQLSFGDEARNKIIKGVEQLANAVKVTLGPKGRNVIIGTKFGAPIITKDGVTVAKEIILKDPYENMGAEMVKEVASKTNDDAGDGTTTATVLAEAIAKVGLRNVTAGANPMSLKRGIDKAVDIVVEQLKSISKPIEDVAEMEQVASISANNDKEIGKQIAEAMEKVGKDGVITVEESKTMKTYTDIVEGMQFDQGFISPYFMSNAERREAVLNDAYVLMYDKKISNIKALLPILEKVSKTGKPLLIVAPDVEGEALATLVVNKLKGVFNCCAIKSPSYGARQKEMMEDIAILTGGTFVTGELDMTLNKIGIEQLGTVKRVIVDKNSTTIIEGGGTSEAVTKRCEDLKRDIENSDLDYEIEKMKERLAKLSGGVAVINVGSATETEMKEKKMRVEDALHATRAAVEEGIVPGGGVALLACINILDNFYVDGDPKDLDEKLGVGILKNALEAPLKQISENAGSNGSVVAFNVMKGNLNFGYNAYTDTYEDMIEAGIIDPTKVVRTALQNAASIASLILTTECLITDIPEEKKEAPAMPQMDGMY